MNVQFGVGEKVTQFYPLTSHFTTFTIPLESLLDPNTHAVSPPDLTDVNVLFGVGIDFAHQSNGGTVLLDNIRFEPVPASQASVLGFSQDTQTFGVVPTASPAVIPPDQANSNIASIYASSLTEMNLLSGGTAEDLADAQQLANTFVYALGHDNQGDLIPLTDGYNGLHNAYSSGALALLNDQAPPGKGLAGQVRLAGFPVPPDSFDLEPDEPPAATMRLQSRLSLTHIAGSATRPI